MSGGPTGDKESLKAKLPAGNLACAVHMGQQLYGSCPPQFNLRVEVGARAHRLREVVFNVWGGGGVSIMGDKRGSMCGFNKLN